ncbi:hypothetical protein AAFF_G00130420 [Aldrovandia affinis]|uniref:Uncharacterized protein n=1 Tax=Aldrovandia affinis TaxID=143900 RepID=A0AAD7RR24_9TELE|nr:hypothetical protein AAFF_G00130420 [Aldrovandia affinis]
MVSERGSEVWCRGPFGLRGPPIPQMNAGTSTWGVWLLASALDNDGGWQIIMADGGSQRVGVRANGSGPLIRIGCVFMRVPSSPAETSVTPFPFWINAVAPLPSTTTLPLSGNAR